MLTHPPSTRIARTIIHQRSREFDRVALRSARLRAKPITVPSSSADAVIVRCSRDCRRSLTMKSEREREERKRVLSGFQQRRKRRSTKRRRRHEREFPSHAREYDLRPRGSRTRTRFRIFLTLAEHNFLAASGSKLFKLEMENRGTRTISNGRDSEESTMQRIFELESGSYVLLSGKY